MQNWCSSDCHIRLILLKASLPLGIFVGESPDGFADLGKVIQELGQVFD